MTLNELIQKHGLDKINSLTKYPSILTYHQLGSKGGLKNELIDNGFPEGVILEVTEKVDGTNGRFVCIGDDYLLGQREMFVYAKGDRIVNSEIIDVMKNALESIYSNDFIVIYGEVYGYRIQDGSKIYCPEGSKEKNFRVFDIWKMNVDDIDKYLSEASIEQITYDREHGWQPFVATDVLQEIVYQYSLERTPIWMTMCSSDLPTDAVATKEWIEDNFKTSHAIIGEGSGTNQKFGRAEGVVIRTLDRKIIRKLRFEDYHKGALKGWV